MDYGKRSLEKHAEWKGKIEVTVRAPVDSSEALSLAYTPGVATPCLEIQKNPGKSYELTRRWNMVAVITDGTAVLGLGDIGPEASMPVMEGKCALCKAFGDVDAVPICVDSKNVDEIVETVRLISKSFGGVNLEDISAPRCFEIEKRLKACTDIPIFHDDQHGTAVITLAGLTNALKLVGKELGEVRIVLNGAGAAATAITRLLITAGASDVTLCDRGGAIWNGREEHMNPAKQEIAAITNPLRRKGTLAEVLKGADVFIGVSAPGVLTTEMVKTMNRDAIVFACANPTPEIFPDDAKAGGAAVVSTGRSDYPNQVNNVLCFPGIFRGALDVRASDINDAMKLAAAKALADLVPETELCADYILPKAFDPRVRDAVAAATAITRLLITAGASDVTLCDRGGAIWNGSTEHMNPAKQEIAEITNPMFRKGTLAEVLQGADVFIGVSAPGVLTTEMVKTMNRDAIVFACANPTPEIFPDDAKAGGAAVVSTGRSDYPNQVNNVLCFPGIFRGALDVRASDINDAMKLAAAKALADLVPETELCADYILPKAFDPRVRNAVAAATAQAARESGVARI